MPNRHVADIVILSCAISAGIHAALVPEHFDEGIGPGTGFVLSAVLLVALAVLLTRRPSTLGLAAAAAVFAGLLAAYALAVTTGLPVLHPEPEAVDGLALFTKGVEALGLVGCADGARPALPPPLATERSTTMNKSRVSRPIPIALTALVAFLSAIGALAVSNGAAMGHGNDMHHQAISSSKAVALRMDMRKLWEDHITWTRMAIISLEGGTPDTQATVGRLLKNQTDIGNAIKPFYGKAAGSRSDEAAARAHPHRGGRDRGREGRQQGGAHRCPEPLDRERGPDRRRPARRSTRATGSSER